MLLSIFRNLLRYCIFLGSLELRGSLRGYLQLFVFLCVFFAVGALKISAFAQGADVASSDKNKPFWETEKVPDKLVKRYKRRLPFFQEIDLNKDWVLNEQEIDDHILSAFKRYDLNKDGLWDKTELDLSFEVFEQNREDFHSAIADDRIKRYELRIKQADKNDDGALSWEEHYRFYKDRFYRMDQNDDADVEYREYRLVDDKLSPRGGVDSQNIKVPEYK
jgi:hypothetical protein